MSTDSKSDALWHVADVLSEDILNTRAEDLFVEAAADHGNRRSLVTEFDRISRRGFRRVRRQRYIERLKQLINLPWPAPRFVMASIGALAVIVIASTLADRSFRSADRQPTNLANPVPGALEPIVAARAPKVSPQGLNAPESSALSPPDFLASAPDAVASGDARAPVLPSTTNAGLDLAGRVHQAKQLLRLAQADKPPQRVTDRQVPSASVTLSTAAVAPSTLVLAPTTRAPDNVNKANALTALQYAAEQGQPVAQWKLGRMYADGDGVPRDDLRAFNYFTQIADTHPDEAPGTPQARFVANAFVSLGHYYLTGIPNSKITADPARARDMFGYAATYFGDADAQYELGRLYLSGALGDSSQAARWFQLAATTGHCRAEVALGDMLFQGQAVPRQPARGLMWLTLGRDCAGPDETWVKPLYDSAFKRASDDERAMALVYAEDWLKGHRE